jgi:hypothetical protein
MMRAGVGVVWIDLTKASYGIHGTPRPEEIGKTQSHGCVRLTNWDALDLARRVFATACRLRFSTRAQTRFSQAASAASGARDAIGDGARRAPGWRADRA